MLGTISIVDLKIQCIIGINPEERIKEKIIYLDIELDTDFSQAIETESIEHTIDYVLVSNLLKNFIREKKFQLIETLAERSCELLHKHWSNIKRCRIKVKKPDALKEASYAATTIERYYK